MMKLSASKHLVFIIDELDRCKPTFAIETLEVIKHFFDIDNISFVLAIDLEQLSHSIATIYGQNMDSDGYLRKFFDLNIKIPHPTIDEYIKLCNDKYEIVSKSSDVESMISKWVNLFTKLECSPRDIDRILKNIKLLTDTSLQTNEDTIADDTFEFYTIMMILKYKYREMYNIVLKKRFISTTNATSGTFEVLDDIFFKPSKDIEFYMKQLDNGKNTQFLDRTESFLYRRDF